MQFWIADFLPPTKRRLILNYAGKQMQPDLKKWSLFRVTKWAASVTERALMTQGYQRVVDEESGEEEEALMDGRGENRFSFDNQTRYTCSIMRLNIIYTCVWCGPPPATVRYFYLLLFWRTLRTHINRSWWGKINLITFLRARKLIICSARGKRLSLTLHLQRSRRRRRVDEAEDMSDFMSFQSTFRGDCWGYAKTTRRQCAKI